MIFFPLQKFDDVKLNVFPDSIFFLAHAIDGCYDMSRSLSSSPLFKLVIYLYMKLNWKTLNLVFFSNIEKSEKDEPALAALNWRRWTSRWQDRKTRRKALTWETRQSELKWWALACRIIQTSVVNERKHGKNLVPLQQQQPDVDVSWAHSSCYPCIFFGTFIFGSVSSRVCIHTLYLLVGKVVLVKLTWKSSLTIITERDVNSL